MTIWFGLAAGCVVIAAALVASATTRARWLAIGLLVTALLLGWQASRVSTQRTDEQELRVGLLRGNVESFCNTVATDLDDLSNNFRDATDRTALNRLRSAELTGSAKWIAAAIDLCGHWREFSNPPSAEQRVSHEGDVTRSCEKARSTLVEATTLPTDANAPVTDADRAAFVDPLTAIARALRDGTPCDR